MSNQPLRNEVIAQSELVDAVVTFVPGAGVIFVDRLDGNPAEVSITDSPRVARFSSAFAAIYMQVGPGLHFEAKVDDATKLQSLQFSTCMEQISDGLVPPDIARRAESGFGTIVEFGKFALASREPTDDDKARAGVERARLAEQHLADLHAAEATKESFETYDHAMISVDGANFYLPFTTPNAILVARVMQYLGGHSRGDIIQPSSTANGVWRAMSLAERALFCTEAQLSGGSAPIRKSLELILTTLTNPLGATRRDIGHYRVIASEISVTAAATPSTNFPEGTRPIFVVGALRDEQPPREEEIAGMRSEAQEILTIFAEQEGMSHEHAIRFLDVIMRQEGRIALEDLLAEMGSQETIESLVERMHDRVQRTLGWTSYFEARKARTPFAGHATGQGGVQQVSGGLNPARTRYGLGVHSDMTALRRQRRAPQTQHRPPV